MNRLGIILVSAAAMVAADAAMAAEAAPRQSAAPLSVPDARRLLTAYYAKATHAAQAGDIPGCVAALTEDVHFSFDGQYFVGRSTFQDLYPKDYKDPTYRVSEINTIVKGREIFDLIAIHGKTPGPGKAYLMFYHFELRDGNLVIPEFISATVAESSLPAGGR